MPETIAARYSSGFVKGWLLFFGAWSAVGLVLLAAGLTFDLLPLTILGTIMLVVFVSLLVFAYRRLTLPGSVIAVDAGGFLDRRIGTVIPWPDIRSVRRHKPGSRVFLMFEVDNPERFLTRAGVMGKLMPRINPKMGFPAINTVLSGLDVPQERIADAVDAWWAAKGGVSPALS
jgi:hypothetical protein